MKRVLAMLTILIGALYMSAKPIDDAKKLYNEGRYSEAVAQLQKILKSTPKDGTANFYLGLCYVDMGEAQKARQPLQVAEDKGIARAAQLLAEIAFGDYRLETAGKHVETWEKLLKKNKKEEPDELSALRSKIILASNMLERVEKIAVIDSMVVDKTDFFTFYQLSKEAGHLLDGNILQGDLAADAPSVVFVPENGKEVFWSMPNEKGNLEIVSSLVLDDGTFEAPLPLGSVLNENGDADYPFFTSDGMTFYFANNGDNSLGGYDIFLSRRSPDGEVLVPQNLGMPYNSAYDDYMLVIDEANGVGWWATDRNQIPDKVTIYKFIPNETRVNYDVDDPDIVNYALLRSIAATHDSSQGVAIPPIREQENSTAKPAEFTLSLGNGKVYHYYDDFQNSQARQLMKQYMARRSELELMEAQLTELRRQYASGNKAVASEIQSLEKRVLAARPLLKKLRNQVITAEK